MAAKKSKTNSDQLHGALDMLVLKVLADGPLHGYAIAVRLERLSNEILAVEEGSLYPALYRMESRGWLSSEWAVTDTGRRARFYRLTRAGRTQLVAEAESWQPSQDGRGVRAGVVKARRRRTVDARRALGSDGRPGAHHI